MLLAFFGWHLCPSYLDGRYERLKCNIRRWLLIICQVPTLQLSLVEPSKDRVRPGLRSNLLIPPTAFLWPRGFFVLADRHASLSAQFFNAITRAGHDWRKLPVVGEMT